VVIDGTDHRDESVERAGFRHRFVSAKPLSRFVSEFWYWRGHSLPSTTESVLPMGTMELVLNLSSERSSIVSGPHSRSFVIERTAEHELAGVHFQPGGAFPFIGVPLGELRNLNLSLADLWGHGCANRLLSRVHSAKTADEKLRVLEEWLFRIAVRPLRHHASVEYSLDAFAASPVVHSSAMVAARFNLSQRRFIRIFRDEVGLPPKLFCRIRRFYSVVQGMEGRDVVNWRDIAEANGYYDQSHFIHEFREFCGLTPTEYLRWRLRENFGHVHVPT
jgi:AraC-like DNA-binding protein